LGPHNEPHRWPRESSAALLTDGWILITGDDGANAPLATAEFFNMDGSISPAAAMNVARSRHISVVLQDGPNGYKR